MPRPQPRVLQSTGPLELGPETLARSSNLTQSQLLLWLGQRLDPQSPLYNMTLTFEIQGPLKVELFQRSFQALVNRSDSLRTVFFEEDGVPQQRVLPELPYRVECLDMTAEELGAWAQERCRRTFDLQSCLFDSVLLKLGPERFLWFFNQHHLTTDAWSASVVFRKLSELYEQAVQGELPQHSSWPSFAAYRKLEREARLGAGGGAAAEYWKKKFDRSAPLPNYYGRTVSEASGFTKRSTLELGLERSEGLRRLARHKQIRSLTLDSSLFTLFAALMYAYLFRVSGQRRLVLGAPAHNRATRNFKETIGMFIEVLPLEVELEEGESLLSLASKVRSEFGAFLRHAKPGAGNPAANRSFNALLNYIHAKFPEFAGYPVSSDWLHAGAGDPRHLIRLQVHDFGAEGAFRLDFDLNQQVFSKPDRVLEHFLQLLDAVLEDPERELATIALCSAEEAGELLGEALPPHQSEGTVLGRLWRGGGVALKCRERELDFSELYQLADRWAAALRGRGVKPGVRVGLCMERCPEFVLGVLAVWRAGGSYLVLDPTHPAERLAFQVSDSDCALVLGTQRKSHRFPFSEILYLDEPAPSGPSEGPEAGPEDPAYMLYTSGSTGRPKGVVVSHGALLNYLQWAKETYVGEERFNFPLFSPLTFDLTVTSLFLPLLCGGTLHIYPQSSAGADLAFLDVLEEDQVDVIKLTPSHLLLDQERLSKLKRLRTLIIGGENLRRDQVLGLPQHLQLFNEYGPTEATVGCIVHRLDLERDLGANLPIGRPIRAMKAYVLDEQLQPLPQGVVGELFLAGHGLAEGYHGREELENSAFVVAPFPSPERLYRTGDLARLREDGVWEYLGRCDHQVKVRGARIELGEIESVLREHQAVEQGMVDVFTRQELDEAELFTCRDCGLASNYPGVSYDSSGLCSLCQGFQAYRDKAQAYFDGLETFRAFFEPRPSGNYDCVALLSGGKDSSYVLYRLVKMGLRVLAFTLDNGFISEQAKDNIRRVVDTLGVDHIFAATPHMNEIFVDSLQRHCNVCQGCFKTIYTLSTQLAKERGIPYIVTGLSRGQFFETRLTEELFTQSNLAPSQIDEAVLEARKAYHRVDDAVSRLLDVELFQDDGIFREVRFLDFYRYCDVDLEEMLETLDRELPWMRPSDTGRSTNCRINDVGIYVHKLERGFHNYALPYSWDVRLGHKNREEALEELRDELDLRTVQAIMDEIGYDQLSTDGGQERLVAYFVPGAEVDLSDLRNWLHERLPDFMMPSYLVPVEEIPLTQNGKVDRGRLPSPKAGVTRVTEELPPRNDRERQLVEIWASVLGLSRVGVTDNFFDLGGDSIAAIRIVARANQEGFQLTHNQIFAHQTVAELAALGALREKRAEQGLVLGQVEPTPIQEWFFSLPIPHPELWYHLLKIELPSAYEESRLSEALAQLPHHHDALRLSFRKEEGRWSGVFMEPQPLILQEGPGIPSLGGPLVRAWVEGRTLNLALHHVISDGLSWLILLEDLERLYKGEALPLKTTSWKAWSEGLREYRPESESYWRELKERAVSLPLKEAAPKVAREGEARVLVERLPESLTKEVEKLARSLRCEVQEVLLSALLEALHSWTGESSFVIDLEGAGRSSFRDDLDLSRTVGWFTSLHPVLLSLGSPQELRRQLQKVPTEGLDYGVLHYTQQCIPEVSGELLFNYLGRLGQTGGTMFRFAEPPSLERDPQAERKHKLEVYGWVAEERLELSFRYSPAWHESSIIAKLATGVKGALEELVGRRFPLANLSAHKLSVVASLLKQADRNH